jgi:hypothetical protein
MRRRRQAEVSEQEIEAHVQDFFDWANYTDNPDDPGAVFLGDLTKHFIDGSQVGMREVFWEFCRDNNLTYLYFEGAGQGSPTDDGMRAEDYIHSTLDYAWGQFRAGLTSR